MPFAADKQPNVGTRTRPRPTGPPSIPSGLHIDNLRVSYGARLVVKGVTLPVLPGKVTAIIGPSGCGKTTILRCLNRLSETVATCNVEGSILLDGEDVLKMDPALLRRKVGMVFQKPNPFPMSVRENILYGIKATKMRVKPEAVIKGSLSKAALWEELKDRLGDSAFRLSLGQQQRLCIARCIATSPKIVLMDEPAASLDPSSAAQIDETILSMKGRYTVVIVTHNMQQAWKVADCTAFVYAGELVELGDTRDLFERPKSSLTKDYIAGKLG